MAEAIETPLNQEREDSRQSSRRSLSHEKTSESAIATEAVAKSAESPSSFFLYFLLALTCVNLFSNVLLNQVVRTNMAYWVPYLRLPFSASEETGSLSMYMSLPVAFLGLFGGVITDWLGSTVALLVYAGVNVGAMALLAFLAMVRTQIRFYQVAAFFYGAALNLSRIPMQKLVSVIFEGSPLLALVLNINHFFSHVASLISNLLAPWLLHNFGQPATLHVLCLVSTFTLPICLVLYGAHSRRVSAKQEVSSTSQSLWKKFGELFSLPKIVFLTTIVGIFTDCVLVSFKIMEGKLYKNLFGFNVDETNLIALVTKLPLLASPIASTILDRYPFRDIAILGSATTFVTVFFFYLSQIGNNPSPAFISCLGVLVRIGMIFFYSAFYTFFAIIVPKHIRGLMMGLNASVFSIGYFIIPCIFDHLLKNLEDKTKFLIFVGLLVFGFVLSIILLIVNRTGENIMNQKAKAHVPIDSKQLKKQK